MQARHLLNGMRTEPSIAMDFLPINPRLPRPLRDIRYVRTALKFLVYLARLTFSAWRYDILHIFSAAYYSYLLGSVPALFIGRLYGKKIILHYHDGQCEDHLRNWRTALPTLRLAHQLITPTDFVVEVMQRFGLQARRIFNVLDQDHFHYRPRARLRPVFMTNRILEPLYNVDCILRAFAIIQRRYPGAALTIAHDGCSRPHLEALARELQLRNVEFLGKVPHQRVAQLYDEADIYLTTPNTECMPGSLLECFASGLPLIATDVGGIPYIVTNERNALLVPSNDHEAVARAAFRLLDDPRLVERLTRDGLAECERYRADGIRAQWVDLYQSMARTR